MDDIISVIQMTLEEDLNSITQGKQRGINIGALLRSFIKKNISIQQRQEKESVILNGKRAENSLSL